MQQALGQTEVSIMADKEHGKSQEQHNFQNNAVVWLKFLFISTLR